MIYLATPSSPAIRALMQTGRIGAMRTPRSSYKPEHFEQVTWAADNDCFSLGRSFDLGVYIAWLERQQSVRETCLFASVPDVVGDALATRRRWDVSAGKVRETGFPLAFVTQDGCTADQVPWDECDAIFTGGTNAWKLSAQAFTLAGIARERGLWTHMGRVNGESRLRAAAHGGGYRTADGTFLAFAPDTNVPRMEKWLDGLDRVPSLLWET